VSKHLRLLLEAGAVTVAERGRERYYALDHAGLAPVTAYVASLAASTQSRLSEHALDALETEVRRTTRERRSAIPDSRPTTQPAHHEETA
jgi:DNA-binding transcriptional ArsR family regulator